jgi:hypothetical protein
VLSHLIRVSVLNRVSRPQEKFTIARILYVPVVENKCEGVKELDVLLVPLAGSPKFHEIVDRVAPDKIEKGILFSRQVSLDEIIPLQHNPIEIALQIVDAGKPGS